MGQKVHPVGFRLGVIRTWDSKWFEEKNYAQWLHEDIKIRDFVKKSLNHAGVSRVDPSIPSIMNLTSADGLPNNSVRAITVLDDGSKLIATDTGLARYIGP